MKQFCFHRFGVWSPPFNSASTSYKVCQARRCEKCGKVEVAYVKSPWNWWFSARTVIDVLEGQQ